MRFRQDFPDHFAFLGGVCFPVLRVPFCQTCFQLGIGLRVVTVAVQIIPHVHVILPRLRIMDHDVDVVRPELTFAADIQILPGMVLSPKDEAVLLKNIIQREDLFISLLL